MKGLKSGLATLLMATPIVLAGAEEARAVNVGKGVSPNVKTIDFMPLEGGGYSFDGENVPFRPLVLDKNAIEEIEDPNLENAGKINYMNILLGLGAGFGAVVSSAYLRGRFNQFMDRETMRIEESTKYIITEDRNPYRRDSFP